MRPPWTYRAAPPYAHEIEALISSGASTNVYLFASLTDAWTLARRRRSARGPGTAMVLPSSAPADMYQWPIVPNGIFIQAIGRTYDDALLIAKTIVSAGTPLAFTVCEDGEAFIVRTPQWVGRCGGATS